MMVSDAERVVRDVLGARLLRVEPYISDRAAALARAAEVSARRRQDRLDQLFRLRSEIDAACQAAHALMAVPRPQDLSPTRATGAPVIPDIEIPRSVLYRTDSRVPAIPRLVGRKGESIRLFLAMKLVEHAIELGRTNLRALQDVSHRRAPHIASWPVLLGYPSDLSERAVRQRLERSLLALEGAALVALGEPGANGRFRTASTRTPSRQGSANVRLPIDFFLNGWHVVLTPPEIALYLALRAARDVYRRRATETVFIPRAVRLEKFHLSDEMYTSHSELAEFALLETSDPEPRRRRGRIQKHAYTEVLPYEFRIVRKSLERVAYDEVSQRLTSQSSSPRLDVDQSGKIIHRAPMNRPGEQAAVREAQAIRDDYHRSSDATNARDEGSKTS
ncbi:hypothetical protein ACWKWN_03275 [Microbacterium trichothecenolyticum]